ncbi:MAG: hypothetical protein NVS3B20_00490 [Polyangiales bacterium]
MKICTIDHLGRYLAEGANDRAPDAEELTLAARESTALARAAFEEGAPDAISTVERLLYVIHTQTGFGPPLSAVASVCWSTLMGAKLKATLARAEVPAEISAEEMVKQLTAAVQQVETRDHPLLDIVTRSKDPKGLVVYTKNWYSSTHGFTKQLFSMVRHCHGIQEFSLILNAGLENINEECDPQTPHYEMRARWLNRLGVEYSPSSAIKDADQTTEAISLQNFRTGLSNLFDPTYALGSFYTIEAGFPGVCRRMYAGLSARGFDDEALAVFKSHSGMDTEHAEEWLTAIRDSPLSPSQRAQVLRGGLMQVALRHEMFEAIRRRIA